MRILKLFLWVILSISSISGNAQRILSEVSTIKGVTSVYVGKTMLRMAGESMDVSSDRTSVDISKLINELTSIEFIMCNNKNAEELVRKKCDNILAKYPFEVISEVTNDDEKMTISGCYNKNGKDLSMLLITVPSIYVLMKGKIKIETLSKAIIADSHN